MKTVEYNASSADHVAPQYREEGFVNEVNGPVQATRLNAKSAPRPRMLARREARWARRAAR